MENPTNAVVAALEREWPNWQIWVVHRAVGGQIWCARRWDDEKHVLNADSADELGRDARRGGQPVSTTPAAVLARLKVTYQGWQLSRTANGFTAVERETGRTITADTVSQLETALARF